MAVDKYRRYPAGSDSVDQAYVAITNGEDIFKGPLLASLSGGGGGGVFQRDATDRTIYSDVYTGGAGIINQNFLALDGAGGNLNTGGRNILIGYNAGALLTTSGDNIAIGYQSMLVATSGAPAPSQNIMIGSETGRKITTGFNNVAIGMEAGLAITTGNNNTLIGSRIAKDVNIILTGQYNVMVGADSADDLGAGSFNTVIGGSTTRLLDDGDGNTGLGYFCLEALQFGDNNNALGREAGRFWVGTSSRNIAIGYQAGPPSNTVENDMLYISNVATLTPLIKGDFANSLVTINGDLTVTGSFSGSGGAGTWTKFAEINVAGDPTVVDVTWDETLYDEVVIVAEGIRCAVNAISLQCALGENNGATMYEAAGNYAGNELEHTSTTHIGAARDDCIRVARNTSNLSTAFTCAVVRLIGVSVDNGALINSYSHHTVNGGTGINGIHSIGQLSGGAGAGFIDTFRFFWGTPATRQAFANVGVIRGYGRNK